MTFNDYLTAVFSSHFTAGFAGAVVRSITSKNSNPWETMVGGIAGMLSAGYVTPAVISYFEIVDASSALTAAFLIGMLGVYAAESMMRVAARYAANPTIPTALTPIAVIDAISNNHNSQKPSDDDSTKS
ncbi:hypothetical protein [Agrobacterium rosae]|uniref:Holin n=1 Tax=Agrobacterium rosae TaxID=1972867 RepID=A0A1R3TLT5_9HYPH|nr:hypothetical protein [Agrobacterium rosae]SCX19700.1 hypothetical protein DSM25559_1882 [Agrobacterium rosae]